MERAATAHSVMNWLESNNSQTVPTLTIHDTTVPSDEGLARCGSCEN